MTARLLIIIFIAGLLAPSQAQENSAVTVRFAAQALPPEMPQVVMTRGETVSAPFEISTERLGDALKAPGRAFALRAEGADQDFTKVKLPGSGSSFVVLLVTGKNRTAEAIVIPNDRKAFKGGDVYAYNSTGTTVLGQLGEEKFGLNPREAKMVRPTGIVDETYYEVRFAKREGDGSKLFSSTRWPVGERERCYLFFYVKPEKPDRVYYRVISEVLHPPEKK